MFERSAQEEDIAVAMSWFSYSIKSFGVLELNAMGPDWGWTFGICGLGVLGSTIPNSNSRACLNRCIYVLFYMYDKETFV